MKRNKYTPNDFAIDGDVAYMQLYDSFGRWKAEACIDKEDVQKVSCHKWCLAKTGYVVSRIDGIVVLLHRWLLGIQDQIDHINGCKRDNRKSNLRPCTESQNKMNRPRLRENKSGFKGVYFRPDKNRWSAEIRANHVRLRLGYFDTAEEAAIAYNKKAKELHGEFAYLNAVGGHNVA